MERLCAATAVIVLALGLPACASGSGLECEDPPVLAAFPDLHVATSCAAAVRFENRDYLIACVHVHPSRLGEPFVRTSRHFEWKGARKIRGVDIREAFVLLEAKGYDGCGREQQVATRPELPPSVTKSMSTPVGSG